MIVPVWLFTPSIVLKRAFLAASSAALRKAEFTEMCIRDRLYALQDPALAHDNEKCDSLMQRYNELRTVQSIMAKRLGDPYFLRRHRLSFEKVVVNLKVTD